MKKFLLFVLLLAFIFPINAQVSTDPAIPTQGAAVTVTFNASGTPLAGYTGNVYAHTGVTVDGVGRWQHVIESWGNNTTQPQLTNIGTDLYELEISPSIDEYYGVGAGEIVTELCFVFRSADAGTQTSDIFIDVYESGLAIGIISPTTQPYFVDASSTFDIQIEGTDATSTTVKIDGVTVHTETSTPNSFIYPVTAAVSGTHEIIVEATDGTETVTDNFIYVSRTSPTIAALPVGVKDGINYIDENTVTLVLHAPYKEYVHVFGSFNNWSPEIMNKTSANINDEELRYWITIAGLTAGQEYLFQYLIDEELKIADPYAEKILDPWNDEYIEETTYPNLIAYPDDKTDGIVSVFQTAQTPYDWQVTNFTPPKKEDLVVYELLVRDFAEEATYQTLIDTIGYFKRLGINVIELMPVNEFDGNISWGYNPAFYFAPDKAYGTKNKLKEFIDVCHQNDIAVFVDVVLNHSFGQSPFVRMYWDEVNNQPSAENLWYNQIPKHPFNVGYDFNHGSIHTQNFSKRVMEYWIIEYNLDGYRFDLSKGFTQFDSGDNVDLWGQYDASRVTLWKDYYDHIISIKPDMYVILEHFAINTEEKELADYGLLFWGNMNHNFNEATMGYNESGKSDLSGTSYQSRNWNDPNLVAYMESHDEERLMFKNITYGNTSGEYSIKDLKTALARIEIASAFFFTIPGPKMIWQFGELGYDVSINVPGRTDPKPIKWNYYYEQDRYRLFQVFSLLINLKKELDVFETTDFEMDVTGATKRLNLTGTDMNVTVIGNFDVVEATIDPNFQQTGTWYDYFSGESIEVTNVNAELNLAPGEYHIYTTVQLETPDIVADIEKVKNDQAINIGLKTFPNPASDKVKVEFNLENTIENAEIAVFNINGQKINTLHSGNLIKGQHSYEWNVNNDQGTKVSKGLYLLKVNAANINQNSVIVVN